MILKYIQLKYENIKVKSIFNEKTYIIRRIKILTLLIDNICISKEL